MPVVEATVIRYTCAACGREFDAHEIVGGYGLLMARSEGRGVPLLVNALDSPVFDEVAALANGTLAEVNASANARTQGRVVQAAFSVACDPDVDGSRFVIGAEPRCPTCGSPQMSDWLSTGRRQPVEFQEPTHHGWVAMTADERATRVRQAVVDALSE
jgi:DNA-directed RNA polymerase subunit RPC12/RpoP